MLKKLTLWLFFTVFAGLLPIGFIWIVCYMTNTAFTYSGICSEIFFFNLILCADGLKEVFEIEGYKKAKVILFCSVLFVIIILSVLYGMVLLGEYMEEPNLQLRKIYVSMKWFTITCLVANFWIQLLGGSEKNE